MSIVFSMDGINTLIKECGRFSKKIKEVLRCSNKKASSKAMGYMQY
jgi:hypothetical protein